MYVVRLTLLALLTFGLAASVCIHGMSVAGFAPPEWLMWLHVGVFLMVPAAVLAKKPPPRWAKRTVAGTFIYTLLNTGLFIVEDEGVPERRNDGTYYLHEGPMHIRDISEEEYYRHLAHVFRGFSGCWMFFYCLGFCILFPTVVRPAASGGTPPGDGSVIGHGDTSRDD